jgi:ferredoxin-NADP reductase
MAVDDNVPPRRHRPGTASDGSEPTFARASRHDRVAEVVAVDRLTATGTVRITYRVADDRPFVHLPGYWVGVEESIPGVGIRHSPYCILTPPGTDRRFDVLLRVFPEGPLAQHLASMRAGEQVHFRGPSGRSMIPREMDTDLVLMATGVGISPLLCLSQYLTAQGDHRRIWLYWGLRLTDDICLIDELDELAARNPDFEYAISLSQPPAGWPQLRGRVTESVPPLLDKLGGIRFCLSGNGAMVEEMESALGSLGVDRTFIHGERFFNVRHQPDPATMDAILNRFVANDLHGSRANLYKDVLTFHLERDVHGRATGPPR